jgi:2-polyprenyl-6-methoxyphenol hydroxylase-like FAD-dependent oxidoreductase
MRVTFMGNGILANLGALYLRKKLPDSVEIVVVGPQSRGGLPLVGESIIEITARFLEEDLELSDYLLENQLPKFALTYYLKLDPDDPTDRRYAVHCNERGLRGTPRPLPGWEGPMARPAAWQLNRETFDRDILQMVTDHPGIERIDGLVTDMQLAGESRHQMTIKEPSGIVRDHETDWLIDVTGRRQLIARRLGLVNKPETGQRDCFWFRLADFDRSLLQEMETFGPVPPAEGEEYHYDRYLTTHHFMGRGNWIWLIPLRAEDGRELMSVGFVSRPDLFEPQVKTMDDFMEQVSGTHPVVADLVRSGKVVDTNRLRNYHYVVSQAYSADRWAIVGDAAFAPDPLFSNGLAFGTIQLQQLGAMIARDVAGDHSADYIEALEAAFWAPLLGSQGVITNWYETMHDPYLSSLRLNWIEIAYFYILLPMVVNRCHYDPDRMGLWNVLQLRKKPFELPEQLVEGRASFDRPTPDHFLFERTDQVNKRAMLEVEDLREVREQILEAGDLRTAYIKEIKSRLAELAAAG